MIFLRLEVLRPPNHAVDCHRVQTGLLRTKEKECDAATDRVASVEDEMRVLLQVGNQAQLTMHRAPAFDLSL